MTSGVLISGGTFATAHYPTCADTEEAVQGPTKHKEPFNFGTSKVSLHEQQEPFGDGSEV